MRKGLIAFVLCAALLLAVTPAGAQWLRSTTVSISGSASPGPSGAASLSLKSDGPDAILFLRIAAGAGKQIDAASVNGQACTRFQAGQAGCGPFNPMIAAGQPFTMSVHSPQGLSPNDGPFVLFATANGESDDGPFQVAYLPAEPVPCKCVQLKVSMKKTDAYTAAGEILPAGPKLARIGGLVRWTLACSRGDGNCSGTITAHPPAGSDVKEKLFAPIPFKPKTGKFKGKLLYKPGKPIPGLAVQCKGPCTATSSGAFFLRADSPRDLTPHARGGKTFDFRFVIVCGGRQTTQTITFVFKANGDLDKTKSSLD